MSHQTKNSSTTQNSEKSVSTLLEEYRISLFQRQARSLLHTLIFDPNSEPFLWPVDVDEYGITNYYDVIKKPIDLELMQTQLDKGYYTTSKQLEADFNLMIQNSITFNGAEHEISQKGLKLQKKFQRQLDSTNKKIEQRVNKQTRKIKMRMKLRDLNEKKKLTTTTTTLATPPSTTNSSKPKIKKQRHTDGGSLHHEKINNKKKLDPYLKKVFQFKVWEPKILLNGNLVSVNSKNLNQENLLIQENVKQENAKQESTKQESTKQEKIEKENDNEKETNFKIHLNQQQLTEEVISISNNLSNVIKKIQSKRKIFFPKLDVQQKSANQGQDSHNEKLDDKATPIELNSIKKFPFSIFPTCYGEQLLINKHLTTNKKRELDLEYKRNLRIKEIENFNNLGSHGEKKTPQIFINSKKTLKNQKLFNLSKRNQKRQMNTNLDKEKKFNSVLEFLESEFKIDSRNRKKQKQNENFQFEEKRKIVSKINQLENKSKLMTYRIIERDLEEEQENGNRKRGRKKKINQTRMIEIDSLTDQTLHKLNDFLKELEKTQNNNLSKPTPNKATQQSQRNEAKYLNQNINQFTNRNAKSNESKKNQTSEKNEKKKKKKKNTQLETVSSQTTQVYDMNLGVFDFVEEKDDANSNQFYDDDDDEDYDDLNKKENTKSQAKNNLENEPLENDSLWSNFFTTNNQSNNKSNLWNLSQIQKQENLKKKN
ncbi:bromodomain-containing protein [Anaeramoeba flamelloides]|uniref:Bromodomain-containing protein n=1 Tax=Anaeramoeba flamelloides TaxID=1746091 RepID=A0ABQ8YLU5_9EUKA|nr:bromodomain-containing protein [Anaeramoeba flamelloides]